MTAASVRHQTNPPFTWKPPPRKNSIDNKSNSPQYLGVASLYLQQLGNDFESGPLKGKIVHGGNFMPAKKKAAKKKKH
jgi:hypothetical protein